MGFARHAAAAVFAVSLLATPALAIGTTDCASGDGQVRRTELEVWGANQVTWIYYGQKIPFNRVKLDPEATLVVSDFTTQHPDYGDQHTRTTVEKAYFELDDGSVVSEDVLCKTVEYPQVID